MNQNYFEPNPCYYSNYSNFDQPPQYSIDHQADEGMSKSDIVFEEIKMMFQQLIERLNEENQAKIEEIIQVTHTFEPSRRFNSICYDDDDAYDYEEDPKDSIIIGNKKLNTILEKESDEFIKSCVEDLVPIPCESEDTSGSDKGDMLYLESFLNDDDPSIPLMSVASILEGFTDEPPLEENDDLFDLEPKNDDW
uniref:Reverse transcriptase domain-containing protein n=1 Tax=Tanacetum cinerariifolium TaxID=118510 RepID=A0A699JJJ1_TANCI|nr:hypothetical protein [Tanacetum cinerariifolium]